MIIPLCIKKIFIEFLLCYWHWSTFSEKYNNAMLIKNRSILRSLWSGRRDTLNKPKYTKHRGPEKYY